MNHPGQLAEGGRQVKIAERPPLGRKIAFPADRSYTRRVAGGRFAQGLAVVLLGLAAGLVYTYPLVLHAREAIPYTSHASPEGRVQALLPGDQLQFYYFLSLTDDMVRGRVPWFRDPYQFSAPHASERRHNFFFLPFSLLFAAVTPLGRIAAYNLLIFLSFPATALSTFLLARRLGADGIGAGLGAAAFTLLPYRIANLAGGHPTGIAFFLLPLALYFLEAGWQDGRWIAGLGAGLCFLILAVNEPHFLFFFVLVLPAWLAFALWRIEATRRAQDTLAAGVWLAVAAIGPTVAWTVRSARVDGAQWTVADLVLLFAVVWSLLLAVWRITAEVRARAGDESWRSEAASYAPLLLLALYAMRGRVAAPGIGHWLAAVTLVATFAAKRPLLRAALGLAKRAEYRTASRRLGVLWPAALGFTAAAALMLHYKTSVIDPSGKGAGRSLREIALFTPSPIDFFRRTTSILPREVYPGAVVVALASASAFVREGRVLLLGAAIFAALTLGPNSPAWLPLYSVALHGMPFFRIIRQPTKLFAVAALALSLACGLGATALGRRLPHRTRLLLSAFALAALLADFSAVLPFGLSVLPARNAAYDWIAAHAGTSNLLELPVWPGDSAASSIYLYWATRTRVPLVNGYSPTTPADYVERVYWPLGSMNLGEWSPAQDRLLDEFAVRFVTLHADAYPPQVSLYPYRFVLAALRANPNVRPVVADGPVHLFERAPGPYRSWNDSTPWPMGAFFEAEGLKIGSGERIADDGASGGVFLRGRPGIDSPVMFGPYRVLPRGRYVVRFRARGRGRVEVAANFGKSILATSAVGAAEWREIPVELTVDHPDKIELRGWAAASREEPLDIDWVLIRKVDGEESSAGTLRFEAEDLTALYGTDREIPEASGGAVAQVLRYPPAPGMVVRDGPYRQFGPGRVLVALRARGGPLRLRVASADGRRRFAEVEVPASDSWQIVRHEVDLPQSTVLCTRLVSAGVDAEVDYVEIKSPPPVAR